MQCKCCTAGMSLGLLRQSGDWCLPECKLGGEQEKTSGRQCRPSLQVYMSCCRLIFTQNQRGNHCKVLSKGMTTLPAGSLYHPTVQNSYESFHLLNPPTQPSCPTLISYEIHRPPSQKWNRNLFLAHIIVQCRCFSSADDSLPLNNSKTKVFASYGSSVP